MSNLPDDFKGTAEPDLQIGPRKFRPDWRLTLIALVMLSLFIGLGTWQAGRYMESSETLAIYHERHDKMEPLKTLAGIKGDDRLDVLWYRRVELTGKLDVDKVHLAGRYRFSKPGYKVLVPLQTPGAVHKKILVDMGWVPKERLGEYKETLKGLADKDVPIKGRLQRSPPEDILASQNIQRTPRREEEGMSVWRTIIPQDIAKDVQGLDPDIFVMAGEQAMGKVLNLEEIPLDGYPGPVRLAPSKHVEYALTWYGVGVALIGVWFALSYQPTRLREEDEPQAQA